MVPSPLPSGPWFSPGSLESQDGSLGADEPRLTVHFKPAAAVSVFLPSGEYRPNDAVVLSSGAMVEVLPRRPGITDGGEHAALA